MGLRARLVRRILNAISPYLEYICFYALYPGGTIFDVFLYLYIVFFDWFVRQRNRSSMGKNYADIEDPQIVGRNRQRAHALYSTEHSIDKTSVSTQVMFLTGKPGLPDDTKEWDFLLVGSPVDYPTGWMRDNFDVSNQESSWEKVSLPNHWQLQGHDIPSYTNTTYPFQFDPPRARRTGRWVDTACDLGLGSSENLSQPVKLHPKEPGENATGLFRRKFTLRNLHKNAERSSGSSTLSRYFLVFAGVDSSLTVWLDGQYVGYSQDSCLPAEFEITSICAERPGLNVEHTLAVQVTRWCDGSYLEDQDKWWLSGIYREVYVERRPGSFISDFEFSSTLSNGEMEWDSGNTAVTADIVISVLAQGVQTTSSGTISPFNKSGSANAIRVEIWNGSSSPVVVLSKEMVSGSELPNRVAADSIYAGRSNFGERTAPLLQTGVVTVKSKIFNPELWSAEKPNLYKIVITLHSTLQNASAGKLPVHSYVQKVGIRTVSISGPDNLLCVNGSPVVIAGINRHEFSAETGRAVTKESMRADAILLKKLNFNAVRSAHYPHHPYWLEVCDEVGLYVIDEANIETHGFQVLGQPVGYLSGQPEWEVAFTTRLTRMYERDKNHPSVIGWSLGNESGFGTTHSNMSHWLRLRDPLRFVQYESGGARTSATDIICPMYVRPRWCEEQSMRDTAKRPVILCEYSHAMGNSGGSLAAYWQLFRDPRFPRVQGGFIWDFVDQGLRIPGSRRSGYGYGGDFGDLPNSKQFCCNGIANPSRELFPAAYEAAHLQSPVEITLLFDHSQNPVILVSNRRAFEDLSDLRVVVRPCIHFTTACNYTIGSPFEFRCGKIAAGCFGRFEIVNEIKLSLDFGNHGFEEDHGKRNALLVLGPSEGWLDVSVATLPNSQKWVSAESFEIMHTAFVSPRLTSIYKRLSSSSNALTFSPLPSIQLPQPTKGWAVSSTTTSNSAYSSGENSPFHKLIREDRRFRVEEHGSFEDDESLPNYEDLKQVRLCKSAKLMTVQVVEQVDIARGLFIRWSDGSVVNVGRACGRLLSWQDELGDDLISAPIDVCFFRAGTDNDRGGRALSYYARWKEVGLDRLVRRSQKDSVRMLRRLPSGAIEIITSWMLESPRDVAIPIWFKCEARYVFDTSGAVDVAFAAEASPLTPPLARCGLRWAMPETFREVKYFGLGPHEAYDDRLASVYLGVFESTVEAMHTHYTFPQDCGRRADPRWVMFKSVGAAKNSGLLVVPLVGGLSSNHAPAAVDEDAISSDNSGAHCSISSDARAVHGWGFSASPYSLESLDAATHDHELVPDCDGRVHIHFDSRTMGLGGYDSWSPNVDEAFMVLPHAPTPTLRQSTMPSYIVSKSSQASRKALHSAMRIAPLTYLN